MRKRKSRGDFSFLHFFIFHFIKSFSEPVSRVLCSLRVERRLSFIYDGRRRPPLSFYPPARTGRPLFCFAGLHELSTPGVHSIDITADLVSSCLTFSPLPLSTSQHFNVITFQRFNISGRRLFSSALTDPCGPLPVRKRDALRCPDFPLLLLEQRQAGSLNYLGQRYEKS